MAVENSQEGSVHSPHYDRVHEVGVLVDLVDCVHHPGDGLASHLPKNMFAPDGAFEGLGSPFLLRRNILGPEGGPRMKTGREAGERPPGLFTFLLPF